MPYALILYTAMIIGLKAPAAHDFHLSRCEITYRTETRSIEVIQQVFADDFEDALRALYGAPVFVNTEKEIPQADSIIVEYLNEHFTVEVGDKPLKYTYLGMEQASDPIALWLYIEIENVPAFESVEVKYDILCELFGDQRNIVVFQVDNTRKQMFITHKGNPGVTIEVE